MNLVVGVWERDGVFARKWQPYIACRVSQWLSRALSTKREPEPGRNLAYHSCLFIFFDSTWRTYPRACAENNRSLLQNIGSFQGSFAKETYNHLTRHPNVSTHWLYLSLCYDDVWIQVSIFWYHGTCIQNLQNFQDSCCKIWKMLYLSCLAATLTKLKLLEFESNLSNPFWM